MPTAPTFSKRFYEQFGHDTVTELADWLNQMDLTYRTQLHEVNELNFARFDAKLEQRISEVKADLHQEMADVKVELRQEMADVKAELSQGILKTRVALGEEIAEVKVELRAELAEMNTEVGQLRAEMRAGFAEFENRITGRLIRWMFVFWTGTTVTLLGAMFAITRL